MEIRTDRLLLRTYRPGDESNLLPYYGDAEVCRYLLHEPWTVEDARTAVTKRAARTDFAAGALALVAELAGVVIGNVEAWTTDDAKSSAEIGWTFSPDASGHGYATEAVDALLEVVFESDSVRRVVAQMDARNDTSARLARRVGMTQEAHFRQNWWCKGEWTDTLVFALLRGDRSVPGTEPAILEHALLHVSPTQITEFETAFSQAKSIISSMPGFVNLTLSRGVEHPSTYVLLVEWATLEDHTVGFRQSSEYQQWKSLLHHFYDPFPVVEHFTPVVSINRSAQDTDRSIRRSN